ncbi:MAG: MurR/RpiR family transcriptional regulator [Erysipelotrichaceae bacterium]
MELVIYSLLNYINFSIKHDTDYDIARCLLLNIKEIHDMSLEQCASLCNVSVSTLNRFFKKLNFYNFSTFREFINIKTNKITENTFDCDLNSFIAELKAIDNIDPKYFDKVARMIKQAKRIYVLGFGDFQFQASYFQAVMLNYGKLIEIVSQFPENTKLHITDEDMVIVTSIGGNYLSMNEKMLKKLSCRKVLITKRTNNRIYFDQTLAIDTKDNENIRKYFISRIFDKILKSYHLNCSESEQM